MVDVNGHVPQPPQPPAQPQLPIPTLEVLYQQLPNGARIAQGVRIAGQVFGGILSVNTGFDVAEPTNEHKALVKVALEVFWPFKWTNVAELTPDLVIARDVPPEPKRPRLA